MGLRFRRWISAASLVGTLLAGFNLATAAGSDDVQRRINSATQLYESLEYERALEQLERAKELPGTSDDAVTISLYQGVILAELRRREESMAAFRSGLLIKPQAVLPVRVSPKVKRDFEMVRAEVKRELAAAAAEAKAKQRAGAEAKAKEAKEKVETSDRPERDRLLMPENPPSASASTSFFSRIADRPLPAILVGSGVLAAGIGLVFAVESNSQVKSASGATFKSDALSHIQSANTDATVANALFALAGVAAIAGVTTFFLQNNN